MGSLSLIPDYLRLHRRAKPSAAAITFAGLSKQGELNVDVLDHDACQKLQQWFDDRWRDKWCLDISDELAEIIDTSWARAELVKPYHIYLKIAYHLSQEARAGLSEFRIPRIFGNRLFEYQTAAVKIAAHHLKKRNGPDLPNVSYSSRHHSPATGLPEGVLVYLRTAEGTDSLAWIDRQGNSVTQSQQAILQAAQCHPDTPATERHPQHHELVNKGVEHLIQEERAIGGQLGRPSGAKYRTYERLKAYAEEIKGTLVESKTLIAALDEIYRYPLRQSAIDTLNRKLREGINDHQLADLIIALRDEDRLCLTSESEIEQQEPQIICSLGLFAQSPA